MDVECSSVNISSASEAAIHDLWESLMQQCRIAPQHWLAFFFLCMSGKQKIDLVTETSAFKQAPLTTSFSLVLKHTQIYPRETSHCHTAGQSCCRQALPTWKWPHERRGLEKLLHPCWFLFFFQLNFCLWCLAAILTLLSLNWYIGSFVFISYDTIFSYRPVIWTF